MTGIQSQIASLPNVGMQINDFARTTSMNVAVLFLQTRTFNSVLQARFLQRRLSLESTSLSSVSRSDLDPAAYRRSAGKRYFIYHCPGTREEACIPVASSFAARTVIPQ